MSYEFGVAKRYTPMWRKPLRVFCATHTAPLLVSRHGAICASVLVSELPDTLSLDYDMIAHLT